MHPLLRELVRLTLHLRLRNGKVFRDGDFEGVQDPEHVLLLILYELLVYDLQGLYAAPLEVGLPRCVVLVDAQL